MPENTNQKDFEEYRPEVKSWEIKEYEDKFKEHVYHDVQFDRNQEGYSMQFYMGKSGVEAAWSGTILLREDSFIKWTFSLQNGCIIEANVSLDDENYNIVPKLYEFYKIWKSEWSQMLTIPEPEVGDLGIADTQQIDLPTIKEDYEKRKKERTKNNIINNHSDRMKKLAGL